MSGGKYGSLIKQARKLENQNPDQAKASTDRVVNLSIKVSISLRRHWVSEAKRQGTSLTAVIIDALTEQFGQPDT